MTHKPMRFVQLRRRLAFFLIFLAARIFPTRKKYECGRSVPHSNRWVEFKVEVQQPYPKPKNELEAMQQVVNQSGRWERRALDE